MCRVFYLRHVISLLMLGTHLIETMVHFMDQEDLPVASLYETQAEFLADPVKNAYGHQGTDVDYHLQSLIRMVNDSTSKLTFGITLFTPTGAITGQLISRRDYFEKFGAAFQGGFERAFPSEDWSHVSKNYADSGTYGDDLRKEGEYLSPPQFIHLENAKLIGGNGSSLFKDGMLWRGKVKSIDGFVLGSIS